MFELENISEFTQYKIFTISNDITSYRADNTVLCYQHIEFSIWPLAHGPALAHSS